MDAWRSGFADTVNLASVLTEGDLARGPMPVFERLIAQAEELRGEDGIVVFQDSCVSVMVGEDVALFRAGESARGVVVRASDNMRSQNAEMLDTFFGRCRKRRDGAPGPGGGGPVVNLVGYDPHRGRPELEALLRASGIEVAASFTPDYDIHRVDDVFRASLNVLYPARHRSRLYSILPESTGVEGFLPPPPYGVRGTKAWLLAVAGRFDRRAEAERAFADHLRRFAPDVERERTVLGLLGDDLAVAILSDPFLARAMKAAFEEVGLRVPLTGVLAGRPRFRAEDLGEGRVMEDPSVFDWVDAVGEAAREGARLVVGSGYAEFSAYKARIGLLEMSYPSRLTHFMTPHPTLGFDGFLDLMDRVVNAWHHAHAWHLMDEQAGRP